MALSGFLAVIIAYLLGSIPAGYITTRLQSGKDIRKLGSGNIGAHNVYRNVGKFAAVMTAIFDVLKGAAAVVIAEKLLGYPTMAQVGLPQALVLLAGLGVVAGHIWSIFLRFNGGNGISPTIGILAILLPEELLWALAMTIVFAVLTRNIVLSVNISLILVVPFFALFWHETSLIIGFLVALILIMVLHFVPDIIEALDKAGSREKLVVELLRLEKGRKK